MKGDCIEAFSGVIKGCKVDIVDRGGKLVSCDGGNDEVSVPCLLFNKVGCLCCIILCIPFKCGTCWMKNLPIGELDDCVLACIMRANLDEMAGKSSLTIVAHLWETSMLSPMQLC